jgi:hypothetical protein
MTAVPSSRLTSVASGLTFVTFVPVAGRDALGVEHARQHVTHLGFLGGQQPRLGLHDRDRAAESGVWRVAEWLLPRPALGIQ